MGRGFIDQAIVGSFLGELAQRSEALVDTRRGDTVGAQVGDVGLHRGFAQARCAGVLVPGDELAQGASIGALRVRAGDGVGHKVNDGLDVGDRNGHEGGGHSFIEILYIGN